jgi:two-component system cell cycle sensor histidine kinase/response regulator CckA
MKDQSKTKKQLIGELAELRRRIAQLEVAEAKRKQAEEALRESEEKFRSLAEYSPNMIFINKRGRVVYANKRCEEVMKYTTDEFLSGDFDFLDMIAPDNREAVMTSFGRHVKGGDVEPYEFALVTKDGRRIEAILASKLIDYEGDRAILGTVVDITERKRAEEALQESERKYRTLFETMTQGVVYQAADGQIISANPAAERILGLTMDQMQGRTSVDPRWKAIHEDGTGFPGETHPAMVALKTGKEVRNVVMGVFNPSKAEYTWINIDAVPQFRSGEEKPYQVYTTSEDITERKRAEQALRESEEKSRNIIESIPVGMHMYQLEPDGRLVFTGANPAADQILGVDNSQYVGMTIEQAFPALAETEAPEKYRLAASRGQTWYTDQIVYEEDQIAGAFEVQAFQTSPGRMVAAFVDITERKQANEALRQSEERYRQLFEAESDAIFLIENESGRILEANGAASALYGYSREELLTKRNTDLSAEPEDTRHVTQETPVVADQVVTIPLRLHRKRDGTVFPVEITGRFFIWQGRPVHIAAIRDISERKQAEEEREKLLAQIQEQAQRVQQIIDTVPEGVLLLDEGERVVLANPVAEGHLSLLADIKVGDTLPRLGDRPLAELLTSPPRGLWHEAATDSHSFQIIARPIEAGPAPSGWVLVIRDVTQQREIEQRIQQQERLASVGQLAAGIAHDFNNIMATIVLYAQMTGRTEDLPIVVRERMETIDQQAEHATRLIQQILDFSRRAVLDRHPLNLLLLLREHVKLLGRTLPESIQVKLEYKPDKHAAPLIVNADPTRMQQMVTNLALNARDAMPEGGELHITLEQIEVRPGESPLLPEMAAGEWAQVTVSDTGTGIPPDVLPHIFEPFFTTRAPLGSGLGLAQVHGIVGQHGGRIDVDTQVGEGTTFTIYLPVYLAEPSTSASGAELSALPTGQGETILIVEDDAVVRKALLDSLEGLNYTVLEAVNGLEALALLEQYGDDVALVLSDVVMPGMGGIALLHALRERDLMVPVVMLTGHPLEKELEDLRAQGIIDWLPKPPQLEDLAMVVAQALGMD